MVGIRALPLSFPLISSRQSVPNIWNRTELYSIKGSPKEKDRCQEFDLLLGGAGIRDVLDRSGKVFWNESFCDELCS